MAWTVKPLGLWQILEIEIRMKGWKALRVLLHAVIIRVFSCVFSVVNNDFAGVELFYGDFFATAPLQGNGSCSISP